MGKRLCFLQEKKEEEDEEMGEREMRVVWQIIT
jgi:hypothetical protein